MPRVSFFVVRILLVLLAVSPATGFAQQPSVTRTNYVIDVTATTNPTPPHVTLHLSPVSHVNGTTKVRRRIVGTSTWDAAITLPGAPTEYQDLTAQRGVAYEYSIQASRTVPNFPTLVYGAIVAGYDVPLVEQRGKVLLYIDETQVTALGPELDQLERNLAGDGWKVFRHHGPRTAYNNDSTQAAQIAGRIAEREAMRATIRSYYDAEPGNDWALLIIGRAPVVYSGATSPDGHGEHYGAWATDTFYADVNGTWTDTTASTTQAENPRNRNIPGDGKYDQAQIPSATELQTGRVDLGAMDQTSVGLSETELLRQYLVRNHRFRRGLAPYDNVARRALIDDTFDGSSYSVTGWQAAIGFFGNQPGQVDPLDWFTVLPSTPMLFAYGGGGGDLDRARDVGTSLDFATKGSKAVFTLTFGSWFADWDNPDNLLRAPLAGTAGSLGLTNAWSGLGGVFLHHMALGGHVGYSMRLTQNNNESASTGGWLASNQRHIVYNLMGDPTLRLHTVRPPTRVTAVAQGESGGVVVGWDPSPDATAGYHVYRGSSQAGPFTRLTGVPATTENPTGSPVSGTSWTDATATPGESYAYLVKAVKMETSASGTYANQSVGEFAVVGLAPTAPTDLQVVATGTTSNQLTWSENATNEAGYQVERRALATGVWNSIATLLPDSNGFLDTNAPAGVVSHYRVRATGSGSPSDYTPANADYTLPGAAFGVEWHKHVFASWDEVSLVVRRFNGDRGEVSVSYATSDLLGSAGTDYAPGNGMLSWLHGEVGDKSAAISILPSGAPKLTRLFKVGFVSPSNGLRLGFPSETFVQIQDPSLQTLPSGWASQVIGSSGWPGYAEHKDGIFGLSTRTSRFGWGNQTDSLRFVWVPVSGDCTLTTRIRYVSNAMNPDGQAGIMIRASLDGNAVMRGILMPSPTQAYQFARSSTGGTTSTNTVNVAGGYGWLRVRRTGNDVATFRSPDGVTWTQVGTSAAMSLSSTAYVGLFVSTNSDPNKVANPVYVQFDNVTVDAALTTPTSLVAAPGALPGEIALTWVAVPGALSYEVERSLTPGSGFATIATVNAASAAFTDGGLVTGVTYYYRVRALNALAQSGYSAEASAQPYLSADLAGWRYTWFATNDTSGLAGDAADPDGDGVPNIAEYASGGLPLEPDAAGRAGVQVSNVGGVDYLTLSFVQSLSAEDVVYAVETTGDLTGSWSGFNPLLPANQVSVQTDTPDAGRRTITVRDTQPISASPRRFMRLRRGWQDPVWRTFTTGFEESDGSYVLNATLGGKIDNASGTSWSIPAGWGGSGSVVTTHPKSEARAWRIADTSTSGTIGATIDTGPAVEGFITTRPWTFKISFSLVAMPVVGTGNQFAIAMGQPTASGSGKQWLRVLYNNGDLNLMVRTAGATPGTTVTQTAVTLGQYTEFANLGDYVTLTLGVDPVGKRYTRVELAGPKGSANRTSVVQAVGNGVIPWGNTTTGDPATHLLVNSSTGATLTLDFDDISLGATTAEPSP